MAAIFCYLHLQNDAVLTILYNMSHPFNYILSLFLVKPIFGEGTGKMPDWQKRDEKPMIRS